MSDQAWAKTRMPDGRFRPGISGNPHGRGAPKARARQQAEQDESERRAEEANLLRDLGREPSATQRIAIETLSAQVVRGRRMRAAGRHAEAEMAERLVWRGLGKLGIRQGKLIAEDFGAMMRRLATPEPATAARAAGRAGVASDRAECTGEGRCEAGEGSER